MNTEEINLLTKRALSGDKKSLLEILNFLEKFDQPLTRFASYSILYQFAFNSLYDIGKYCEECGGKCCKSGDPIQVFNFDYEEIKKMGGDVGRLRKNGKIHLLSRPCPFQNGWACSIHKFKPYSCLSYPFATEDEQMIVIKEYKDGIPDFKVPEFCTSGKVVKDRLNNVEKELREKLGRIPSAKEILEFLMKE
ncbi:YkgJ family cysteine cluster protein, partial [Acidianus sp. RZ1]